MKTIHKYVLPIISPQKVVMAAGAEILKVALQGRYITVWAKVDLDAVMVHRNFNVYGTGWELAETGKYLNSIITNNGEFVWHIFDEGETEVIATDAVDPIKEKHV